MFKEQDDGPLESVVTVSGIAMNGEDDPSPAVD